MGVSSLQAQVNKEVEVTRSYIPTVSKAEKPILEANINDTSYINPEVDYSITPLVISTQLQNLPIKASRVTYWEFNKPELAQIKVGAGAPLNSLLQGYISTHNASVGYLHASVDHRGNYSKLMSDNGGKISATQVLNSAEVAGGLYVAKYTLSASVGYSNNQYNKYAFEQSQSKFLNYQDISTSLRFGDNFVDLSRFNFSIGGDYSHYADRADHKENDIYVDAQFGKMIGRGRLLFGADYRRITGGNDYINSTASLHASLERGFARNWQLALGAEYYYDRSKIDGQSDPSHYIIPHVSIKSMKPRAISPYAEVSGSLHQNSFSRLSQINPYVLGGLADKSSVEYNFAAGIMGQTRSSLFAYRLYAAYDLEFSSRFWELCVFENGEGQVDNNYFNLVLGNLVTTSLNLELDYKLFTCFSVGLDAHLYSYGDTSEIGVANSKPDYETTLSLDYAVRKLSVGIKTNLVGARKASVVRYSPMSDTVEPLNVVELPLAVNLGLYADWRLKRNFSIFLEGDNLCNAKLYPWAIYRGFGVSATAGVKIKF